MKKIYSNPELAKFSPRELIAELKARGYIKVCPGFGQAGLDRIAQSVRRYTAEKDEKVRIKIGKRRQEQVRIILMKQLSQQLLRRFLPWRERLRSGSGSEALCTDLMKKRYGSHMRVWKPAAGKDGKDR